MTPTQDQVLAGQAVYTSKTLSLYDFIVLGISNRYIWKCPTPRIEAHYNAHVTANHLDVGVGSGYFPDHCQFPTAIPRVALMDMNDSTLVYASERIARYSPETYRQNVLEPVTAVIKPFDSLGINYLFHCVPGKISEKAKANKEVSKSISEEEIDELVKMVQGYSESIIEQFVIKTSKNDKMKTARDI